MSGMSSSIQLMISRVTFKIQSATEVTVIDNVNNIIVAISPTVTAKVPCPFISKCVFVLNVLLGVVGRRSSKFVVVA